MGLSPTRGDARGVAEMGWSTGQVAACPGPQVACLALSTPGSPWPVQPQPRAGGTPFIFPQQWFLLQSRTTKQG